MRGINTVPESPLSCLILQLSNLKEREGDREYGHEVKQQAVFWTCVSFWQCMCKKLSAGIHPLPTTQTQ